MVVNKTIFIKECPHCQEPFWQLRFLSYNTFGATFWTDGKMEAPFCPEFLKLVKCHGCESLFWIDEARNIGKAPLKILGPRGKGTLADFLDTSEYGLHEPHSHRNIEVSTLQGYLYPSDADCLAYLKSHNTLNDKKLRFVRMRAWWAANDYFRQELRRRKRVRSVLGQSLKTQDNMRMLFELLDQTDEKQRLLKAEIARELGSFDLAGQLLSHEYSEKLQSEVDFLRELTEQRKIKVAPFCTLWP